MLPNPQSPPAPTSEIPHPTSPPPTHWLFAATIPLPPLPDSFDDPAAHDRLLSDYLDWTGNYVQLAQKHGLDFDTFDRWLHSDTIQTRIKRIDAMSDLRAKTLAKQHRAVAITRLVEIVEDTRSSPVRDRVRAASQILKAADKADTRELREAKAAAHRALTQIATTKTDDEPSTLSLVQEPLPEGGAGVGSVPHPTTEAGPSLRIPSTHEPLPAPSSFPRSEFRAPRSPEGPPPGRESQEGRQPILHQRTNTRIIFPPSGLLAAGSASAPDHRQSAGTIS